MEKYTVDYKTGAALPVYFDCNGDFTECNGSMLRLAYVIEGNGIMNINGQTVIFSSPALFCFNELDEVVLQQSIDIVTQAVYFNPKVINDSLQLDEIRKDYCKLTEGQYRDYFLIYPFMERVEFPIPYIEIGPLTSKRVYRLFEGIKEELTGLENEFWPCRSRSYLLETLFLIQNIITDSKNKESINLHESSKDISDISDISDIILYLHTNYDKKITIEELTDTFHMNRTTLSEKFRKAVGFTIIEYLVRYRIKMASVMLRETFLPVSEILNRVGFNDSVYFSRMFKKHTGCTPSNYREKYI